MEKASQRASQRSREPTSSPLRKLKPQACSKLKSANRYIQTGKLLGIGAYGEVYLVQDKEDGQAVRKEINLTKSSVGLPRNFVDETSLLSSISLPTVVTLQSADIAGNQAILYQNYGGKPLADFHLDEIEAKPIIFSLLTTIFSLATRGVIHGDLKPENVLYNEETERICLIDFGHAHQGLPPIKERPLVLNDYGGTEAFFSPERKRTKQVTLATEVYSIGLIWYQLLTGEDVEHDKEAVWDLSHLNDVSEDTQEIIRLMLEANPKERITIRELIEDEYFEEYTEEERTIIHGFAWYQDSCYVDSLLMVLLFSCDKFWRKNMLGADVGNINEPLKCEKKELDIDDPEKANKYRREVQDQLKLEWNALLELNRNESESDEEDEEEIQRTTCTLFRKLVAKCLPSTRESVRRKTKQGNKIEEVFVMYGAPEFYSKLVDIFPGISLDITTYNILTNERRIEDAFKSFIPVNQYLMAPPTKEEILAGEGNRWTIDWSAIDLPVLVFANIVSPRFSILDATGDERGDVNGAPWAATKIRAFGMTILDGAYTLIGVVTLQGVRPNRTGGVHYVSHFRGEDGLWYFYNDLLQGKAKSVRTLPRTGIWEEANLSMPAMYFYAKTSAIPKGVKESPVFGGSFLKPSEALNLRYHPIQKLDESIFDARNDRTVDLLYLCRAYKSNWATYFLAVKIMDIALSTEGKNIGPDEKLIAACYLLAAKLYDPPTPEIFRLVSEWAELDSQRLAKFESRIYQELCFDINYSTAYDYFKLLNGGRKEFNDLRILIRTRLIYEMTDRQLALIAIKGLNKEQKKLVSEEYSPEVDSIELEITP